MGRTADANFVLASDYADAAAYEATAALFLDGIKTGTDYATNPTRVIRETSLGLVLTLDAVLRDDKPVLQSVAEIRAGLNDPRTVGTAIGRTVVTATVAAAGGAVAIARRGVTVNVPNVIEPFGPPTPNFARIDAFLDAAPSRIGDLRGGLPNSRLRSSGTVAVADVEIPGLPSELAGHSRVDVAGNGFVGTGSRSLPSTNQIGSNGFPRDANIDAEYRILDNIADRLGNNPSATGRVTIFVEIEPCKSCANVALPEFRRRYPNIQVEIKFNGTRLRPAQRRRSGN